MKRPRYIHWVVLGLLLLIAGVGVSVWLQHPHTFVVAIIGSFYCLLLAVKGKRQQSAYDWARENPEEARKWLDATGGQ